jgi:hypothetical protein
MINLSKTPSNAYFVNSNVDSSYDNTTSQIVISRYIRIFDFWFLLKTKRRRFKVVFFFDDDLFDFKVLKALPLKYALKIFFSTYIFKSLLGKLFDEFWVSSPYLYKKYAHLNPKLIVPHQVAVQSQNSNKIIVCYHGSASHIKEIEWLINIISEVQAKTDHLHFEIFGTASVNKLFKNIPRVSVLHPMSWENYLAYTLSHKADIGLAPLLDTKFNLGRSPTKFFDYARMGAVGIYTNNDVYNKLVVDDKNGVLLDNDQKIWVEKIIALSADFKKLKQLKSEVKKTFE